MVGVGWKQLTIVYRSKSSKLVEQQGRKMLRNWHSSNEEQRRIRYVVRDWTVYEISTEGRSLKPQERKMESLRLRVAAV